MDEPQEPAAEQGEYAWLYALWVTLGYEPGTIWRCRAPAGGLPSCPECHGTPQGPNVLTPLPLLDVGVGCVEGHRYAPDLTP